MTLDVDAFIRRFLIHVLPKRFHRIRHHGLFADRNRAETLADVRELSTWTHLRLRDDRERSGTTARTPLLLLRRPHVHHRDFRS
jgi:hypothetical protein